MNELPGYTYGENGINLSGCNLSVFVQCIAVVAFFSRHVGYDCIFQAHKLAEKVHDIDLEALDGKTVSEVRY